MVFNPRATAFFILALASLGIAAFMYSSGNNLTKDISFDFHLPTGMFTSKTKTYIKADIVVNGSFSESIPVSLNNKEVLLYVPQESVLIINDIPIHYIQPVKVRIFDFKGDVVFTPYDIYFKGNSKKLVNDCYFVDKVLSLNYNGSFISFYVSDISTQDIKIPRYVGKILASIKGDKIVYDVSGKDVEVKDFEGYLRIDRGIIELKGSGMLRTDVLEVYGKGE